MSKPHRFIKKPKKSFNLRLKEELINDIKVWAAKKQLTVTAFMEIVLRVTIQKLKDAEKKSVDAEQI